MINDILQDREGFLWIATKDGLNRYDGSEIKVFTNDSHDPWSISGNEIRNLFEDSAGRIWASSDNAGLNIYDKITGRFHHLRHDPNDPASLSGNSIHAIGEDSSGYFIITVDKKMINMFRLEDDFFNVQQAPQITRIALPTQQKSKNVSSESVVEAFFVDHGIVKDAKDRIWLRSNKGLFQLNVQKNQLTLAVNKYSFDRDHAVQNDSIWGLAPTQESTSWDGFEAAPFSNNLFLNIDEMLDIRVDENTNIWMIWNSTLYGFDSSKWTPGSTLSYIETPTDFQLKPIKVERPISFPFNFFYIDRSSVLWIGTNGYGLYKMNLKRGLFSHHLPGVSIRNIITGFDNKLYIENWGGELFNSDNTRFVDADIVFPEGCFPGDILISKKREYWIRFFDENKIESKNPRYTSRKYDPITKKNQLYKLDWRFADFQPMIECKDGSIWMAGLNDALAQVNPVSEDIISYDLKDGTRLHEKAENEVKSSEDYSTALYEDTEGILWVGTERGFTKCIRPQTKDGQLQITHFENIPGDQKSLNV
jgi:ligand-binding sensor domain-containing protein